MADGLMMIMILIMNGKFSYPPVFPIFLQFTKREVGNTTIMSTVWLSSLSIMTKT